MGRLIDADELIVMEYGGIKFVPKEFVDDAPTVDAIPVEYILKRMDTMNDFITEWGGVAEKESLVDSYVHDVCALARLVYAWRKKE